MYSMPASGFCFFPFRELIVYNFWKQEGRAGEWRGGGEGLEVGKVRRVSGGGEEETGGGGRKGVIFGRGR